MQINKKIHIIVIFILIFCNNISAQFVNSGTNTKLVFSSSGIVCVISNLDNKSAAAIINNGQINLKGDFSSDATSTFISGGSSKVKFCGTAKQKVEYLNGTLQLNDAEIDNTSGVDFAGDVEIDGSLTLTNGIARTYDSEDAPYTLSTLSFTSNAVNPSENTGRYILGKTKMNPRNVGIGAIEFIGFKLYAGADNLGNIEITRTNGTDGIIEANSNTSAAVNWLVVTDNQPVSGRSLELKWLSAFDNGKDMENAVVYKSESPYTAWGVSGDIQNVSGSDPRVISTSTTTFSKWTPTDDKSPLPVELINLGVVQNGNDADVTWETASELNCSHYEVFRSFDAVKFEFIGQVPAVGNSYKIKNYSYKDKNITDAGKSIVYYKLRNVDIDGTSEISNIVYLELNNNGTDLIEIMPVPFDDDLVLNIISSQSKHIEVSIYNCIGSLVFSTQIFVNEGHSQCKINLQNLASGLYFVNVEDGRHSVAKKTEKR